MHGFVTRLSELYKIGNASYPSDPLPCILAMGGRLAGACAWLTRRATTLHHSCQGFVSSPTKPQHAEMLFQGVDRLGWSCFGIEIIFHVLTLFVPAASGHVLAQPNCTKMRMCNQLWQANTLDYLRSKQVLTFIITAPDLLTTANKNGPSFRSR